MHSGAAPDPQSLLVPEAPPASKRDLTPRDASAKRSPSRCGSHRASQAAARSARPAPKPAQLHPAPRRASAPVREQAAALSAAGFAPTERTRRQVGQLVFLAVAFAFAVAFADASRSVAAEVRARGEDPDPPPTRPG